MKGSYGKRQIVEHRGQNDPLKGKRQPRMEQCLISAPQKTVGAGRVEDVKSEHSWRQNEGQRDDHFDEEFPAPPGTGQPGRQRKPQHEEDRCRAGGDGEGQTDGGPVHLSFSRRFEAELPENGRALGAQQKVAKFGRQAGIEGPAKDKSALHNR